MENSQQHTQRRDLIALLPWVPSGPVLDAGCGPADLSFALANYGFEVEAIDVNPQNIEAAYQKYGSVINWEINDIRKYKLKKNHYAAIFCLNVLPFIPDEERGRLISRLKAAVKPGGFLIIEGFNKMDPSHNKTKFARKPGKPKPLPTGILNEDELKKRLNDWKIIHSFEGMLRDNHPPKGEHQHGISEIIAIKPEIQQVSPVTWSSLPVLGAGSGWRRALSEELSKPGAADLIEVILDDYLDPQYDSYLAHLNKNFTVVAHGVELSIGSAHGLDEEYLQEAARIINRCNGPWWSDHLCFTNSRKVKTYGLNVLPATEETLAIIKKNIKKVKNVVHKPLLLENVAYYVHPEHAEMDEVTFFRRAVEENDCGILLDVANLFGNAMNLGFDPKDYIDMLPLERVVQVHIAGGRKINGILFDTHDHPVWKETWDILNYLVQKCNIKAITIERDDRYEEPQDIVREIAVARKIMGFKQ